MQKSLNSCESRAITQQWLSLSIPFLALRHPSEVAFVHFQNAPSAMFRGIVKEGLVLFE